MAHILFGAWIVLAMTFALPTPARSAPDGASCYRLQRVIVDDGGLMTRTARRSLLAAHRGSCIDARLLKALLNETARYYLERGYVTTRPYLRHESIVDGVVTIYVMRGVLAHVVDADLGEPTRRTRWAFAFQEGRLLNLRDIESALETFNRPPSSSATFDIRPGRTPGSSVVAVKRRDGRPWRLKLGMTARRENVRDDAFGSLDFEWDNPLDVNDMLSIGINGNRVLGARQSSRAGQIAYSFPLPVTGALAELSASRFFYSRGIQGVGGVFPAKGRTTELHGGLQWTVFRNQRHRLKIGGGLRHRRNRNYLDGQLIGVSSFRTTMAELNAGDVWLFRLGSVTWNGRWQRGVGWFGGRADGPAGPGEPVFRFRKFLLDVNLDLQPASGWRLKGRASMQRTPDLLYDSEKMSVGGDYTVRGYVDGVLYGNNAWHGGGDLIRSWRLDKRVPMIQEVSLSVGADYGRVRCETDNAGVCGDIAGVAAGVTMAWPRGALSVFWSRPLRRLPGGRLNLFRADLSLEL